MGHHGLKWFVEKFQHQRFEGNPILAARDLENGRLIRFPIKIQGYYGGYGWTSLLCLLNMCCLMSGQNSFSTFENASVATCMYHCWAVALKLRESL